MLSKKTFKALLSFSHFSDDVGFIIAAKLEPKTEANH